MRYILSEETKKEEYVFYVDAKRYDTPHHHRTGAEIKQQSGVTADYQLYLEEEGDQPDRAISDGDTVDLKHRVKHFYAVPPATFGLL
jgi:Multiubiquitin